MKMTIYVISETAYEEAAGLLKPSESQRPKRFGYYHSSQDIALFQKFHSSKVPRARVIRNKDNEWGFYLANIQKWLPFEKGIREYQFKPVYPIHQFTLEYGYPPFSAGNVEVDRSLILY